MPHNRHFLFMNKNTFNLNHQEQELSAKITVGLERISEAFKVLLWEKAKNYGLSPIQIQILIFIANHKIDYCNVSYLAKEFNVTKPTVSDAIKVLNQKGLIIKTYSSEDSRRYNIVLSDNGKTMVGHTEQFAFPLQQQINRLNRNELNDLFNALSKVIYQLNKTGILTVQRTCFACKYYSKEQQSHYCNLLQKTLFDHTIRIDCNEFEMAD